MASLSPSYGYPSAHTHRIIARPANTCWTARQTILDAVAMKTTPLCRPCQSQHCNKCVTMRPTEGPTWHAHACLSSTMPALVGGRKGASSYHMQVQLTTTALLNNEHVLWDAYIIAE